ncbi:MAG: GNAT family N-acetyltransferase [Thermaerobacter sp.]|nr:GNAT family N-acetyltransferase [Thermaerobacter sp.]
MTSLPTTEAPQPGGLCFRPLTAEDLPLLQRWLSEGAALEWYALRVPPTAEAVSRKYLPRVRGEEPVDAKILLIAGQPAGYFQSYRLEDFPDHPAAAYAKRAAGIDFFLAQEHVGHGVGPRAIAAFVREVVFARPEVEICFADPAPRNQRSVRALRRAGFREVQGDDKSADRAALLLYIAR